MPFGGSPPFSDTHLPRALARRRRVLVIDRPLSLHHWRPGQPWRLRRRLVRCGPQLWRLTPLALPGSDRPVSARASDPLIAAQVEWAARRVLPDRRVLVTFDPARGWCRGVRRDATVYWRRDIAAQTPHVASVRHVQRRHDRLVRAADLVTGVSPMLVEDSLAANPRAFLLPNGADVAHFARPGRAPAALQGRGTVVGFAGAVSWRVDTALVEGIARRRPGWTIVLVGRVTVPLPRLANLLVVGDQPYDDLPGWVHRFGVGIVPYTDAAFNRASFPLKVFDYLASGVPVVTTPLPALRDLVPCVRLAGDVDEFVREIELALAGGPPAERCRRLVTENSWDARAEALERLVEQQLFAAVPH
jgi:glycosyltransferase involved in cell wall biosynthesis